MKKKNLTNGYRLVIYFQYKFKSKLDRGLFYKMSFYVTLPSDSSMHYFPDNKISHFMVRLPTPIELTGEWEVGLVEFIYPHTWYNVNIRNNLMGFDLGDGVILGRRVPPGFYETVPDILKNLLIEAHLKKLSFQFNDVTKRVTIKVKNKTRVILSEGLAQLLGFEEGEISCDEGKEEKVVQSINVADPCAHYRVLLVYTDIVEPQVVGDVLAPLLRIVNVSGSDGEVINAQYDRPHYLPVNRKIIENIEIVIRTHTGELTPFERGRSYVKLHFRQKYLA